MPAPHAGGARLGSGRDRLPSDLVRSVQARLYLRPGQAADLADIAAGWGVPPATAAYAMVASFLSDCRRAPAELGKEGLQLRAACLLLKRMGEPAGEPPDPSG